MLIGAFGAAIDIAMDIAASMAEVKEKSPEVGAFFFFKQVKLSFILNNSK
ncbi:MAG: YibE/F family protein [Bacillota bacterium]